MGADRTTSDLDKKKKRDCKFSYRIIVRVDFSSKLIEGNNGKFTFYNFNDNIKLSIPYYSVLSTHNRTIYYDITVTGS